MKTRLFITIVIAFIGYTANAQCHYIPSTSQSTDTLSYIFSGGSFQSYGCEPIDPTFWLAGYGDSVTVTFVNPESYPSFRVWGMNTDDVASVRVNGVSYPLNSSSASYDPKVICGISPGPDGVIFVGGNLVGANTNSDGNYSYQNVQVFETEIISMTIIGISGLGWGFAGVSVDCPLSGISQLNTDDQQAIIYPNPVNSSATIQFNSTIINADLNIYNQFGQEVRKIKNISGHEVILLRDNLPGGLYFLRLTQKNKILLTDKLVISD